MVSNLARLSEDISCIFVTSFEEKAEWKIDWNTSKENQAPTQKFERPYRKIPKSNSFFTSVKN